MAAVGHIASRAAQSLPARARTRSAASPTVFKFACTFSDGEHFMSGLGSWNARESPRRSPGRPHDGGVVHPAELQRPVFRTPHLRGVPLAVIAKWQGHAAAATTAHIYATPGRTTPCTLLDRGGRS
jgi:hypothetical protein